MRANQLVLRYYAESRKGVWNAYCLDLSLGSQADSFEEARQKLDAQIDEYLKDALGGQDKEHAVYLMTRKAPFGMWVKYWCAKAVLSGVKTLGLQPPAKKSRFKEVMNLVPGRCHS